MAVRLRVAVRTPVCVCLAIRDAVRDGVGGIEQAKGLVECLAGFPAEVYVAEGCECAEETLACSQNEGGVELLRGSAVYMLEGNGY